MNSNNDSNKSLIEQALFTLLSGNDQVLFHPYHVPASLQACRSDDGSMNMKKYKLFMEFEWQKLGMQAANQITNLILLYLVTTDEADNHSEPEPPQKKSRRQSGVLFYKDEDGNRKRLLPTMSHWYNLYCCTGTIYIVLTMMLMRLTGSYHNSRIPSGNGFGVRIFTSGILCTHCVASHSAFNAGGPERPMQQKIRQLD